MVPDSKSVRSLADEDRSALQNAVQRFASAWRQGSRPPIDDYLPADEGLRRPWLMELVHLDLDLRVQTGEAVRVEEYLARYPELAGDRVAALELIAAEYKLRRRREPHLGLDEYLERFPPYRGQLSEQIARTTVAPGATQGLQAESRLEAMPEVAGYEVLELLGHGGMGVVYKARQQSLHRLVALKVLPTECSQDPVWLQRFRREALTASALNHPHICTIYDTGVSAGRPFLSMEWIDGQTLRGLVGQRLPVEELARLLGQAARALAAAHAAGVVHRDIKPENLMVRGDGIVKVLDFGLARRLPSRWTAGASSGRPGTDPDAWAGTARYMSPEQGRAEAVGTASDIFSLGVVLYELATGQHPFGCDTEFGVLHAIVSQVPLPPSRLNPEIPASLDALLQQMLAKDPGLRPTALEVDAILTHLTGKSMDQPRSPLPRPGKHPTVGRQPERAALRAGFESAAAGRGLLLCVTGEPGLGKTTLVEDFLDELATGGRSCGIARGRCSERLAGTEAYLPFLEALDHLLQGDGGAVAAQAMKLLAPTWYVQLAPLAADEPSRTGVAGASQEHRKRELGVFLHEVSRLRPLVLFLDDVHWADPSSVDLISYLGGRCAGWSMLLVLAYRPSELLRSQHPFGPVKLELQGRGVCREIALPYLSRCDVAGYLALAFAGHQFPEEFAAVIHAKTEGNPLFMVDLLRYQCDRGVIVQDHGRWSLGQAVPDFGRELPESVRSMIQRKTDQLGEADRRLLMAAAVQGPEFDAAVVAQILGQEEADVEERLGVLERVHALVRPVQEQAFPDGTLTLRYGFVHGLYQNALYASLRPARKAAWSAAAAQALLGHYGANSAVVATELALLFEAARDRARAASYFLEGAENAGRVWAHQEAAVLARRGLEQLALLPDTPACARQELRLQMILSAALQATQGYASPEAGRACERARALCGQLSDDGVPLFPVLYRLWLFYLIRAELQAAQALAEQCLRLAHSVQDSALVLEAHLQFGSTLVYLSDYPRALGHCERVRILFDPAQHAHHSFVYGHDPLAIGRCFAAWSLWALGYPTQALTTVLAALSQARELGHPMSLAGALFFANLVHWLRREAPRSRELAETLIALAAEQGMAHYRAAAVLWRGWALIEEGLRAEGVAQLRQGAAALQATGVLVYRTVSQAMLAEVLAHQGQVEEGLAALAQALAVVRDGAERYWEAELHRLHGELLLKRAELEALAQAEAEACFRQALAVARRQSAKVLELRAAMSLSRLYQRQGRQAEARPLLAETYGWFTEGFETRDLQEAKALLDELA
jgi:serine/threonine protein kinase/predicted ATPase